MMSDATEQVIVVAIDDNAHSEYAITCKFDICLRLSRRSRQIRGNVQLLRALLRLERTMNVLCH